MNLKKQLQEGYVFLDGAMGTMLQRAGLKPGEIPELWNLTHPEELRRIHRDYVQAGAQVVLANTFGANRCKIGTCPAGVFELVEAGVRNAKEACGGHALVALDVGPTGKLLEPTGSFSF